MDTTTPAPRPTYERHEDDEWFDNVTIECVERWKESEMSGDEWRFSYVVTFSRKGQALLERGFSKLEWALAAVPSLVTGYAPADNDRDKEFEDTGQCAQPGCTNEATIEYRKRKDWCRCCGEAKAIPDWRDARRRFCDRHKHRGDCGLDDSDANYELVTP
jgi:hypothetical protein